MPFRHGDSCGNDKEEPSSVLHSVRKEDEGKQGGNEVLLASMLKPIQGQDGSKCEQRNENNMSGMQREDTRTDQVGTAILQSELCDDIPQFSVDMFRADQLRCCGNGVVVLQGAVAFIELLRRSGA
jgi:hypothetical protein